MMDVTHDTPKASTSAPPTPTEYDRGWLQRRLLHGQSENRGGGISLAAVPPSKSQPSQLSSATMLSEESRTHHHVTDTTVQATSRVDGQQYSSPSRIRTADAIPTNNEREAWEDFTARTFKKAAAVEDLTSSVKDFAAEFSNTVPSQHEKYLHNKLDTTPSQAPLELPTSFRSSEFREPQPIYSVQADPLRQGIKHDIEATLKRHEHEHEESRLAHQQIIRRLQKDHAASEAAFRSIVVHLETQLRAAHNEMDTSAERARLSVENARAEFTSNSEAQAKMYKTIIERERLEFHQRSESAAVLHEQEISRLTQSVHELAERLNNSVKEVTTLKEVVGGLEEELEATKIDLETTTSDKTMIEAELSQLRNELARIESESDKQLKGLRTTNDVIHKDGIAKADRLNAELEQQKFMHKAEVKELKQLLLETKQEACEKVRSTIDDYQARSQSMKAKFNTLQKKANGEFEDRLRNLKQDMKDEKSSLAEEIDNLKTKQLQLVRKLEKSKADCSDAIERAVAEAAKDAIDRQVISDDQHSLELKRMKEIQEQFERKVAENEKLAKQDINTLSQLHLQDLAQQQGEFEFSTMRLRKEVVSKTLELEQLQLEVQSERSQLHKKCDALRIQRDNDIHAVEDKLMNERLEHKRTLESTIERVRVQYEQKMRDQTISHESTIKDVEIAYNTQISELSQSIKSLKSELSQMNEKTLNLERANKSQAQKQSELSTNQENTNQQLRSEILRLKNEILTKKNDHDEELRVMKSEYELKCNKLLPISVQEDLESTITALKEQIVAIEMKSAVFQDQLNMRAAP